jgi:hypothetical protein
MYRPIHTLQVIAVNYRAREVTFQSLASGVCFEMWFQNVSKIEVGQVYEFDGFTYRYLFGVN